jgi:hypothetical protein
MIYVSWTEQWDISRYIDNYLHSRRYVVDESSRLAVRSLISKYPGKAPLRKGDVDYYLDANMAILGLVREPKQKKR